MQQFENSQNIMSRICIKNSLMWTHILIWWRASPRIKEFVSKTTRDIPKSASYFKPSFCMKRSSPHLQRHWDLVILHPNMVKIEREIRLVPSKYLDFRKIASKDQDLEI
jgi:hypothetical protein